MVLEILLAIIFVASASFIAANFMFDEDKAYEKYASKINKVAPVYFYSNIEDNRSHIEVELETMEQLNDLISSIDCDVVVSRRPWSTEFPYEIWIKDTYME